MTYNATGSSSCAEARTALAAAACVLLAGCAAGPGAGPFAGPGPATAQAPLAELNLRSDPIPPILLQARNGPYAAANTLACGSIAQEVAMLDAVLGTDYDTAAVPELDLPHGGEVRPLIAYFIPFREALRELSGGSRHEVEFRQAISAGLMRRAYLKGRGEALGCPYPARPYPSPAVRDPTDFEDLGEPPPEQPADRRRLVHLGG